MMYFPFQSFQAEPIRLCVFVLLFLVEINISTWTKCSTESSAFQSNISHLSLTNLQKCDFLNAH